MNNLFVRPALALFALSAFAQTTAIAPDDEFKGTIGTTDHGGSTGNGVVFCLTTQ